MKIVVLISGNGSNLQAIIDAAQKGLPVKIAAVISNQADAYGLKRAEAAAIPTYCISHRDFQSRNDFEHALQKCINQHHPDLIALAGFMRKLGPQFVEAYQHKIINIHPSLLPKYPGLDTHKKVLEAGDSTHGVTIHFVTNDLDAGPIIAQKELSVEPDDTEATLKERIHTLEHQLYPEVLKLFAEKQIQLINDQVLIDSKPSEKI